MTTSPDAIPVAGDLADFIHIVAAAATSLDYPARQAFARHLDAAGAHLPSGPKATLRHLVELVAAIPDAPAAASPARAGSTAFTLTANLLGALHQALPSDAFDELASHLCWELAQQRAVSLRDVADALRSHLDRSAIQTLCLTLPERALVLEREAAGELTEAAVAPLRALAEHLA